MFCHSRTVTTSTDFDVCMNCRTTVSLSNPDSVSLNLSND